MDAIDINKLQKYSARYPEMGNDPIPVDFNTSPNQFEKEREVFRRAWHIVGRIEDIPQKGDYFKKELPTLKTSIIVARGNDGVIRAFHNTCQHRGNKLVTHSSHSRNAKGFSCAFHGWTFDTQGNLVLVPDEDQFEGLDKKNRGLALVNVEMWEGFIFIAVQPRETLKEWLGERYDQFNGYFNKDLQCFAHYAANVKVNWKICLDAFAEGYHVPFIHGKTLPDALMTEKNPLCHMLNIELYKRNRVLSAPANPAYEPSPVEKIIMKHVGVPVFPALKADLQALPPGVNSKKDPMWGFDINIIFPASYFAAWANGMLLVYHFWPISVDETRWEVCLYWSKPKNAAERINQELTSKMTISVVREDLSSLETTQETMLSGSINSLILSDQEIAVRHGYKVLENYINQM